MTNFDKLKNMTIEELAEFIDEHGMYDNSPWMNWWSKNYCDKCESAIFNFKNAVNILDLNPLFEEEETECAYCEVYGKCRYFPDLEETPSMKDVVKIWLEADVDGKILD